MKRTTCRGCESANLEPVLDLGNQPPSNALISRLDQPVKTYPLLLVVCTDCWLMQLETDVPHSELFNADYAFRSASNKGMMHGQAYVDAMRRRFGLHSDSCVVEAGGNDGTLLKSFDFCRALNIDPSESAARAAREADIPTYCGRLQDTCAGADLLIANNVMAHDPDLDGFIAAIARNLAPTGTAVIEFPWAVSMLEHGEFDTIYHEHYSYLSITALIPIFRRHNLYPYDVERLPIHGGSLRLYVDRLDSARRRAKSSTDYFGVVLWHEQALRNMRNYQIFRERAFNCVGAAWRFIANHQGEIYGMGAAAKATVFTNFAGLTYKDIPAIGDNTPAKQGKWIPGACIPIVPEAEVLALKPKYLVLFPWNWKTQYAAKLRSLGYKGKFVVAIPELEIFE